MARKQAALSQDPDQKALEHRVDKMMSVEPVPELPVAEAEPAKPQAKQPLKIAISEQATAPQLPPDLLKGIGKAKAPKSTIKIIKEKTAEEPPEPEPDPEPMPPPEPSVDETPVETKPLATDDPLDDGATDKAVDSIVAEEANMQLAVSDAVARQKAAEVEAGGPGVLQRIFTSPWAWLFIIGIAGVAYAWFH